MAYAVLSSTSYLNYLNDYINIILNKTNRYLIEHLNDPYFDEIEAYARFILAQWQSEEIIDQHSSFYIENVGHLNRKIASLTQTSRLHTAQLERIENLLCNPKTIHLITSIIQSILDTNSRHQDDFLRHVSILIDAFSSLKHSKSVFNQITKQALDSPYYQQYLTEAISSKIQPVHLFFIGAIGQLALSTKNSTINKLYSQFITTFYRQKNISNNIDVHYCTLGILSQIDTSFLINDYPCISALMSIFINASSRNAEDNIQIFVLPILNLFNCLCIQSKTVACYLNTDPLIDILLQYVTDQDDCQIHIQTCLLLGHIISEKQLFQLGISYRLTMKLMDLLSYYKHETENILYSLLSLTIHESIQFIIADTYQLITLIQLSEHYPIIYDIIWKLSFHSDIIDQLIHRHDDFLKQLSTLAVAKGILQNVQIKNLSRLPTITELSVDIGLVSSPKDHLVVQQIEENFRKKNLHIGAAHHSSCILLCISEESKHDCACQAIIRQGLLDCKKILFCIVQKPYRIDDWFDKLNIQERQSFNIVDFGVEKLSSKIQKDLHHLPSLAKRTRIVTPTHEYSQTTPFPPQAELVQNTSIKKIQNWTNREVLAWCEKNNLSAFTKILTLYDGHSLLALAHMSQKSAPHIIVNQLRNDCRKQGLRLSFVEFVRFQASLMELLRSERNMTRRQPISTLANRYIYNRKTTNQT